MKKIIFAVMAIGVVMLSGCSNKEVVINKSYDKYETKQASREAFQELDKE